MSEKCKDYEEKFLHGFLVDWCKPIDDIVCCDGNENRCWVDKRSLKEKLESIEQFKANRRKARNEARRVKVRKNPKSQLPPAMMTEILELRRQGLSFQRIANHLSQVYKINLGLSTVVRMVNKNMPK